MIFYNWSACENTKILKRESHNDGVLFLYTVEISQIPFFADFCPWESKDRATLHKATYTQSNWYSRKE